jgi:hypothetical protein
MRTSRGGLRPLALASLSAASVLAASLFSCGIETVQIYSPPTLVDTGGSLTLTHDTDNAIDGTFLGYEIYYHVYDNSADNIQKASDDRKAVEALAAQASSTPDACIDKLSSLGFKRIKDAGGLDSRPLFAIAADSVFTIVLPPNASWYYYGAATSATHHEVSRWISEPGDIVSFVSTSGYASGDSDFTGSNMTSGTIHVVFFAVAYGFDITTLSTIESLPASTYTDISLSIAPSG